MCPGGEGIEGARIAEQLVLLVQIMARTHALDGVLDDTLAHKRGQSDRKDDNQSGITPLGHD